MATIAVKKTEDFISNCVAMATDMLKLPAQHVWLDYDREADVLYMSFRKPQRATTTVEMDNDLAPKRRQDNCWFDNIECEQQIKKEV